MSEAPERIWICPEDKEREWAGDWKPHMGPWVEYIRKDHVDALIAAAYQDAANLHKSLWRETSAYKRDQIRKRAPTEARQALSALLKAERERALREAAAVARGIGGLPENTGSPPSDFSNEGYNLAANDAADTILALISEDATDG